VSIEASNFWVLFGDRRIAEGGGTGGPTSVEVKNPPIGNLRVMALVNGEERYSGTISVTPGGPLSYHCITSKRRCDPL
jgi:hypothetical protein